MSSPCVSSRGQCQRRVISVRAARREHEREYDTSCNVQESRGKVPCGAVLMPRCPRPSHEPSIYDAANALRKDTTTRSEQVTMMVRRAGNVASGR